MVISINDEVFNTTQFNIKIFNIYRLLVLTYYTFFVKKLCAVHDIPLFYQHKLKISKIPPPIPPPSLIRIGVTQCGCG